MTTQENQKPASSSPDPAAVGRDETAGRPIRVCFISPLGYGLYNPEGKYPFGGAEVQFYLLSRELARDPAYAVTVLTTVNEPGGTEACGRVTVIKRQARGRLAEGPRAARLLSLDAWRGYWASFREMRNLFREIDADVYVHGGAGVEVGAYALICRLLRRRFVYVVVSSADLDQPYGKVEGALKHLYPLGLRLAHAIICQTEEHQASLKARYGRDSVLVRTGYEIPDQLPKTALSGGKAGLLWVGRGHPLKQPDVFLDLAKRLPKERCTMLIMKDERHADLWQRVLARAAALKNVTVREAVLPWDEVDRLFTDAKLFVNTSTYEGFPNTFVQAAMRATPILSWAVDPDRVLARHRIGLCAGRSFERLAVDAERLCAAEPQRAEMGRRAWEYAKGHHDLHRSVAKLKALVQSLGPHARHERAAQAPDG